MRICKASGYCYLTGNLKLATAHHEINSINERGYNNFKKFTTNVFMTFFKT